MDEPPETAAPTPPPPTLRRRNSIGTTVVIPAKFTLPSTPLHTSSLPPNGTVSSASPLDFDLVSLKSSLTYTSLKDLLPSSAVNSPTSAGGCSAYEISIRNRLVKQAAWAYLQPMSTSPDSSGPNFLRRFWLRFSTRNPISACLRFFSAHIISSITEAFDRILRAIGVRPNR